MKATTEQIKCLHAFNDGGSLKIEATAGSGKTTTLRYLVHRGAMHGRALYTSFGKKNIEEAKARFPRDRIDVRTNHSLGFRRFGTTWERNGRLTGFHSPGKLVQAMGWLDATFSPHAPVRAGAYYVLATLNAFVSSSDPAIHVRHALPVVASRTVGSHAAVSLAQVVTEMARSVWERMMDRNADMPISHDVYLKAFALSAPQLGYSHIFLDEAQDTSDLMIGLLTAQENCQLTLVGDRFQGIYGFRGAVNAMDRFDTDNYASLSQSFRFGLDIASVANAILSSFLETKTRVYGLPTIPSRVEPLSKPYCILARTNSALFGELIDRAVKSPGAKLGVVGGVKEFENLVLGAQSLMRNERTWVPELSEFANWHEVVQAIEDDGYKHLATLVNLVETYGCQFLLGQLARVKGNELDEKSCTQIFSTAHKAKGREFPTVRLCDDFSAPPPNRAERANWNREEGHLLYVAVTRAQLGLDITTCFAANEALNSFGGTNLSRANQS